MRIKKIQALKAKESTIQRNLKAKIYPKSFPNPGHKTASSIQISTNRLTGSKTPSGNLVYPDETGH
jgi:hypothetical protein